MAVPPQDPLQNAPLVVARDPGAWSRAVKHRVCLGVGDLVDRGRRGAAISSVSKDLSRWSAQLPLLSVAYTHAQSAVTAAQDLAPRG